MVRLLSYINRSLAAKLIIAIGLIIIAGGGISWYVLINAGKKNLMLKAVRYTASYSDLVKKSTYYSMLTYHPEAIQNTVENIGSSEDIRKIRIFNGKGRIFYSSKKDEIGHFVDRGAVACVGCHTDPENPSETLKSEKQWVITESEKGERLLTFIEPIFNEASCYTGACHTHTQEKRVLGVIETDFSLFTVDEIIRKQTLEITIYAILFMSISSIVLYFVFRRFVLRPVSTLSSAMRKVADGDLSQMVNVPSQDEISILANTFNLMIKDLNVARERMESWTQTLQAEVAKKTDELRMSQNKLIQAEKLASLGRLTADVAHEIRNPLTAIGGFARRLSKITMEEKEKDYVEVIMCEINKLEKILRDVLTFSRDARYYLERHNIADIVNETFLIYEELCREQHIAVEINMDKDIPPVLVDIEQVRRAIGNLIVNAIDAMPKGGVLTITGGIKMIHNATFVFLRISDTGKGIPEEKLPLIFEPFYTTKEIGHGTGLGLSITRKIIEEHGGFIKVESTPDRGSDFTLYFPYQSEEESQKIKCWEYMKCERDKDATIKCPAYPNFGRVCWVVAGTFCEGKVQGTFAQKYEDCKKCEFYQRVIAEEV